MEYRKLECGIVIRINDDGTSDWPYGPRSGLLHSVDKLPLSTIEEFNAQAATAWRVLTELQSVLERACPELYDVTFAAIGYASLTYDESRGASMRTHALRMVRFAVQAFYAQKPQYVASLGTHQGVENFIGQIDANVDIYRYRAVLSRQQWQLLLARYDSGLSLDEIAREFNFGSRTTAMNKIEQALAICRRLSP